MRERYHQARKQESKDIQQNMEVGLGKNQLWLLAHGTPGIEQIRSPHFCESYIAKSTSAWIKGDLIQDLISLCTSSNF